jgi:hypothetical protein
MTKLATIQLLIEDDPENPAEDTISHLLRGAEGVIDWAYAQTKQGEFTRPLPFPDVESDYREGDFADVASKYAIALTNRANVFTNLPRKPA